jgi:hypothetical protein
MSAEQEKEGGRAPGAGFTVTDRRIFADEKGTARVEEAPAAPRSASTRSDSPMGVPAMDFHTFVLSLGSSALLALGELERPGEGAAQGTKGTKQTDLPMAKHTIDILAMLQEKTRGNLNADEERLLESLLYDLRLAYVEAQKK